MIVTTPMPEEMAVQFKNEPSNSTYALREAARTLRTLADFREEYLRNDAVLFAADIQLEVATTRMLADILDGQAHPLHAFLPSWRWDTIENISAAAKEAARVPVTRRMVYEAMTLQALRKIGIARKIRVGYKHPSQCNKAPLIDAILADEAD